METRNNKSQNYSSVFLKCITISFLISIILFILFAVIITFTDISEKSIPIVNSVIMIVSIAVGSMLLSSKISEKGWMNGAFLGVVYVIILMVLSKLMHNDFIFDLYVIIRLTVGVITGIIGGMIGVNLK